MTRRPRTASAVVTVGVERVHIGDRILLSLGPEDPFWTLTNTGSRFGDAEEALEGAIVWLKPPASLWKEGVEKAAQWLRDRGALVKLLPADRVSDSPVERPAAPLLTVADTRAVVLELATELSAREGVPLADVMVVIEHALAGAGL